LGAAIGSTGTLSYRWEQSSDGVNWTNAGGTYASANYTTPALLTNMYYRRKATRNCGTITSAAALVTVDGICIPSFPAPTNYVDIVVKGTINASGDFVGSTSPTTTDTLRFMIHNLGADPSLTIKQQMAYPGCPLDMTVFGGWYQWGRKNPAHTFRCTASPNVASDTAHFTKNLISVAGLPGSDHGKFVYGNTSDPLGVNSNNWADPHVNNSNLWGNGLAIGSGGNRNPDPGTNNPCPEGWRVPTEHEWALLSTEDGNITSHSGDEIPNFPSFTLARSGIVWVKVKDGKVSNDFVAGSMCGYALYYETDWNNLADDYKDGSLYLYDAPQEPRLFLPAAGMRQYNTGINSNPGTYGYYWSSTIGYSISGVSEVSYYLLFAGNSVTTIQHTTSPRGRAASVRCIAE
jgi:hypothetical protein